MDALSAGAATGLVAEALVLRMNPEVAQTVRGVLVGMPLWASWGMLLVGVPLDDATNILEEELLLQEAPVVTLEPNWLNRLPLIPTRITVRILQAGEQI